MSVSFLIPVKNAEVYLKESLDSVFNQEYKDFNIVVVDDGSTDSTIKICKSYKSERLVLTKNPGSGLVDALNHGLELCSGNYVARMDADDICEPSRLTAQVKYLNENKNCGCVCSDIVKIDSKGSQIGTEIFKIRDTRHLQQGLLGFEKFLPIIHPSCTFRHEILKSLGGYRKYDVAEDYDLWLRMSLVSEIHRLPMKLLRYRMHENGVSAQKAELQQVNTVLAAINHTFNSRFGIDLYISHGYLLNEVKRCLCVEMRNYIGSQCDLNNIKRAIKEKKGDVPFIKLIKLLIRCPHFFFPSSRRRQFRRLTNQGVVLSQALLSALNDIRPSLLADLVIND